MKHILAFLFLWTSVTGFSKVNPVIDSLQNLVDGNINDTIKIFAYSDLCWEYRLIDQKKAINNGLKGVNLSRKINFPQGEGKTLNDLSIIYIDLGKLDSAIILLNEAIEIRQGLSDELGVAAIHNKLGIIYQNQSQLEKALIENLKALEIYEKENVPQYITHVKNNMANIHFRLGNYEKAIDIHKEALKLREQTKDYIGMGHSYVNIGNVYNEINNEELAIKNYKKGINIFEQENDDKSLALALNNLGSVYLDINDLKNSKKNLEEALRLREKIGDTKGICSTNILLGQLYTKPPIQNYKKSESALKRALLLNKEIGLAINEKDIYHELSNLYKLTNNADSAIFYSEKYNTILQQEYQTNLDSKVTELQTIYETEKKDKENEILARINAEEESKRKVAELKLANRNKWIIGITFGSMALLFLALLLIQKNKQKAKTELQLKLDLEREKGIKAVFDSQEKERSRISKDLHDGIGQQLSGLKMAWEKLSSKLSEGQNEVSELTGLTKILNDTAVEVRNISHQMMPKTLKEFGLVSALEDMLESSFKFTEVSYEFENFGIDNTRFNDAVEISLYRVSQELINNIIKHAKATKVNFQIFKTVQNLQLIVTDDGVGFDNTSNNSGHGLDNIKTRLSSIEGKIDFTSDNGTEVRIIVKHLKCFTN
jgi:signal transduction histidine kinase